MRKLLQNAKQQTTYWLNYCLHNKIAYASGLDELSKLMIYNHEKKVVLAASSSLRTMKLMSCKHKASLMKDLLKPCKNIYTKPFDESLAKNLY